MTSFGDFFVLYIDRSVVLENDQNQLLAEWT